MKTTAFAAGVVCATALISLTATTPIAFADAGPSASLACAEPAPGNTFTRTEPENAAMNPAALADALNFGASAGGIAVQVYRHGCLVGDRNPTGNTPLPLASASKGVTSLVVGRAVTMGLFGIDDTLDTFFPGLDPTHAHLTVRNILNQNTGLKFSWPSDGAGMITDPVLQTLSAPAQYPAGTTFQYAQNVLSLLPRIIENTSGTDFQTFAHNELMTPLGINRESWVWLRDNSNTTIVSGGLAMSPEALARIGTLMLHNGRWNNEQLVDPGYLQQARTGTAANPGYGFLTWLNSSDTYQGVEVPTALTHHHPLFPGSPRDLYSFEGALGQFVTIVPSLDMVIIRLGIPLHVDLDNPAAVLTGSGNPDNKELFHRITAAVTDQPAEPYVNPYDSDDPKLELRNLDDITALADPANVASILLGTGAYADNNCNALHCNGNTISGNTFRTALDATHQITAAIAALR